MAAGQQLLFAPEKPLVKRLGKQFFRKIPEHPGIYKMRDAADNILYVGKAKNLRQRLRSYRVANPERLSRRHLRLLQSVANIEFEICRTESAALKEEARLIRKLQPRFNRAGIWQGRPQFLVWRFVGPSLELAVHETPLTGWERFGSVGAYAPRLRAILARLLFRVLNPATTCQHLPHGWTQNHWAGAVRLDCAHRAPELQATLAGAFWGDSAEFINWLAGKLAEPSSAFERIAIAGDITELQEFFAQQTQPPTSHSRQMPLL